MFLATDVHYDDDSQTARVAGVTFERWDSPVAVLDLVVEVAGIEPYAPGAFFRRELPCLRRLLDELDVAPSVILVDGLVDIGPGRAGLGRHLYTQLHDTVAVVGVAKSFFRGADAVAVLRGTSIRPLWVNAAGLPLADAVSGVQAMHGDHRLPTLLTRVDHLARGHLSPSSGDPRARSRR